MVLVVSSDGQLLLVILLLYMAEDTSQAVN